MILEFLSWIHSATGLLALPLGAFLCCAMVGPASQRGLIRVYAILLLTMAGSSFGLFRATGALQPLHGVSVLVVFLGFHLLMTSRGAPRTRVSFDRQQGSLLESFGILLLSTLLETVNRILVPWLTARGFEDWLVFWSVVGAGILVLAGLSLPVSRAARRRLERYRPGV